MFRQNVLRSEQIRTRICASYLVLTIKTAQFPRHTIPMVARNHRDRIKIFALFSFSLLKLRSTQIVLCGEFAYKMYNLVNNLKSVCLYTNKCDSSSADRFCMEKKGTLYFIWNLVIKTQLQEQHLGKKQSGGGRYGKSFPFRQNYSAEFSQHEIFYFLHTHTPT